MGAKAGDLLATVATLLRAESAELCAALLAQIATEIPDLAMEGPIEELLAASVAANVSTALGVFDEGAVEADLEAPAAAVEFARRLAQRGIPISSLLRSYRLGQAGFQQRMTLGIAAQDPPSHVFVEASLRMSTVTFAYIDQISEQVVSAYQAERDRWMRNRGAVRSARVMALLANGTADVGEVEKALGYPLRQSHRGVVVWADDGAQTDRLARLERVIARLADRFTCERPPLVIAPDDSTIWAWLPVAKAVPPADDSPLADEGTWIALGEAASGVDGFRLTHRQARQAQIVAMTADSADRSRLTESAEAGLVALICGDLDAVRMWLATVLGGLAIDDPANARLRETARIFLRTGGSYTASAQELLLHKNTVQYRIRKADEARGRPLSEGRIDVEVALLAAHLLGSTVLQPMGSGSRTRLG